MRYPSFAILYDAITELLRAPSILIRATSVPIAGLIVLDRVWAELPDGLIYFLLIKLASLPFYVLFAVAVHRLILLGSAEVGAGWLRVAWGYRELQFAIRFLQVVLVWVAAATISAWSAMALADLVSLEISEQALSLIYLAGGSYALARACLVLPAAALDQSMTLKRSWQRTAGYGLRIMAASFAPLALVSLLFGLFSTSVDDEASIEISVIASLVGIVMLVIQVSVMSVAFRGLVGCGHGGYAGGQPPSHLGSGE